MRFGIKYLIITIFLLVSASIFAQPELDIKPNRIEFEDLFNRFDFAFLINKGDEVLTIDSLDYNNDDYIIEFENNLQLPFNIIPDDSVRINVTLSGFYNITINDTLDTIYVHNNGIETPEPLRVKVDFFEDEFGEFNGTVSDSLTPLDSATIYFFYYGIYLLDTAQTSASGFYQKTLPEGEYTIGAERNGYYVLFHDSTYDPFWAKVESLDSGEVQTINFNLKSIENTGLSVSGEIIDSSNGSQFEKGIIIVRKGTHVPTPLLKNEEAGTDTINAFAGFVREDGSYKVDLQYSDFYYLQAYTNNFLPGFYNDEGIPVTFWQDADSVLIDSEIIDKNIALIRDSSYGAGRLEGSVQFTFFSDESNFEGITLFARNLDNDALYSFNFGKEDGAFNITNIPYGTYEIIAQKIGIDHAFSKILTIDSLNTTITGIIVLFTLTDVNETEILPESIVLYPNYPNPFNPSTTISFYLPKQSNVELVVYNILGEKVATLLNNTISSGTYNILFDASQLASGIYFYTLRAGNSIQTRKMLLLK